MATELSARVGERIREARMAMGLTQGQFADLIDAGSVNNQRVSDWERGKHKPSDRYMKRIAEVTGRMGAWFLEERPALNGTGDLLGALGSSGQLDRIEAMLRDVLGRLDAAEAATSPEDVVAAARRQRDERSPRAATTGTRTKGSGRGTKRGAR